MAHQHRDGRPCHPPYHYAVRPPTERLRLSPKDTGGAYADLYYGAIESAQRCRKMKAARLEAMRCTLHKYGTDESTTHSRLAEHEEELNEEFEVHLNTAQQVLKDLTRCDAKDSHGRAEPTSQTAPMKGRKRARGDEASGKFIDSKRRELSRSSIFSTEVKCEDDMSQLEEPEKKRKVDASSDRNGFRYPSPGSRYIVSDQRGHVSAAIILSAQLPSPLSSPDMLPSSLGFDDSTGVVRWRSGYGDGERLEAHRHYLTLMSDVPDLWGFNWVPLKDLEEWEPARLSPEMVQEVDKHAQKATQQSKSWASPRAEVGDAKLGSDGGIDTKQKRDINPAGTKTDKDQLIGAETNRDSYKQRKKPRRVTTMTTPLAPIAELQNEASHERENQPRSESNQTVATGAELDRQQTWSFSGDNDIQPFRSLVSFSKTGQPKEFIATIRLPLSARQRFRAMMETPGYQQLQAAAQSRQSTPVNIQSSSSRRGGRYMAPRSYREETLDPGDRNEDPMDDNYVPGR